SDTFVVIVTRGHRHDAEALRRCISSNAAYIGMIGSIRKIELMRKKFLEEGQATLRQFNRVHAPIGVNINSKTVEEIAVSIAAQLVQVRSQIQEKGKEKK
ncbi:MAG: XdhC family protein, partial [Candidatus Aminicenantes bacterium]